MVHIPMKQIVMLVLAMTLSSHGQRRVDNAPKLGDAIPKVSAHAVEDLKKVDLSAPSKPTVLIFGSHT